MNGKNPAVKRIMADVRELQKHPSPRYHAQPLEDNIFEWHFTIRGPADTDFKDGIYHGRILLPTDYPMKPPNFVFLTKNGRFEVGAKICLSISAYHEESWQPAWGIRTMLEAIISFMPSEGMGAIGALDWTSEERKKLAAESKNFCCSVCGKVVDLLSEPENDAKPSGDVDESRTVINESVDNTTTMATNCDQEKESIVLSEEQSAGEEGGESFNPQDIEGLRNANGCTDTLGSVTLSASAEKATILKEDIQGNSSNTDLNYDTISQSAQASTPSIAVPLRAAELSTQAPTLPLSPSASVQATASSPAPIAAENLTNTSRLQQNGTEGATDNLNNVGLRTRGVRLGGVPMGPRGGLDIEAERRRERPDRLRAERMGGVVGRLQRDSVDEWMSMLLLILGCSIGLLGWRMVVQYYSIFFD